MNVKPRSFAAWMLAMRPKTWAIALAPVFVGTALAFASRGRFDPLVFFATALLAVCMQAVTNMENDAGYTRRKAERSNRKGLPRATSLGLLSVKSVERAILLTAAVALADTAYLVNVGGAAFLAVTLFSLAAAYLYMGGPHPIAYTPFGELTVLVFFGLVATAGTYYLQTLEVSREALGCGFALGCIASNVLSVNNFRDFEHDASIGRRTLAVVCGPQTFLNLFAFVQALPYVAVAVLAASSPKWIPLLVVFLLTGRSIALIKAIRTRKGDELNAVLFQTVALEMRFALLMTAGAVASGWFLG